MINLSFFWAQGMIKQIIHEVQRYKIGQPDDF
ncbi:MAG: hypothetical protein UZ12_BCD005002647 [Bacteroidetes bacterium OLB12]|nr:MAG: hypothetical protein UZ12_BCD005002647 [Bacteroidetes bacterium OLB12]